MWKDGEVKEKSGGKEEEEEGTIDKNSFQNISKRILNIIITVCFMSWIRVVITLQGEEDKEN